MKHKFDAIVQNNASFSDNTLWYKQTALVWEEAFCLLEMDIWVLWCLEV